jgi:hypothetical protein
VWADAWGNQGQGASAEITLPPLSVVYLVADQPG